MMTTDEWEALSPIYDKRHDIFFMMDDAVGMYLLSEYYLSNEDNTNIWLTFWNKFPKGYKGKLKEKEASLIKMGESYVSLIIDAIQSEDTVGIEEYMEAMTKESKLMLDDFLGDNDSEKLGKLIK